MSWEGHHSLRAQEYPLQLISPHPRFSFHTHYDKHAAWLDEIPVHRVQKNGYAWWPARLRAEDASERGIRNGDIVKLYNDRATVLCIAVLTGAASCTRTPRQQNTIRWSRATRARRIAVAAWRC